MEELERPGSERRDVVAFEDIQGHRHERTLRPRTARVHVDAPVGGVDRRLNAHALSAKIVVRDSAACLAHERRDLVRDVPLVDRVARRHDRLRPAGRGIRGLDAHEPSEESAELALHEDLALTRRAAVRQEHRRARRPLT